MDGRACPNKKTTCRHPPRYPVWRVWVLPPLLYVPPRSHQLFVPSPCFPEIPANYSFVVARRILATGKLVGLSDDAMLWFWKQVGSVSATSWRSQFSHIFFLNTHRWSSYHKGVSHNSSKTIYVCAHVTERQKYFVSKWCRPSLPHAIQLVGLFSDSKFRGKGWLSIPFGISLAKTAVMRSVKHNLRWSECLKDIWNDFVTEQEESVVCVVKAEQDMQWQLTFWQHHRPWG